MRIPSIAEINIFIVNRIFHWRFWIAKTTRHSKIMKKIITYFLFRNDDTMIIPNVKKISINKEIKSEGSSFLPTDIIKEVVSSFDDIVIMNKCLCRNSNDCKDYPIDIGCIFLGPTARKIPEQISHKATKEEAFKQIDEADKAGLSHIMGKNRIDSVWMNVKPAEGLFTICHCCPCCCLWKVYPNLADSIQDTIHKLPGVQVEINKNKCINCKKCLNNGCYSDAIYLENDSIHINQDKCLGCGICTHACKHDAITITYNNKTINSIINKYENILEVSK